MRGRVYRRCGCRDRDGRQLGASCPTLASDRKHGSWSLAVDRPTLDGSRKTIRRSGFATKAAANDALGDILARFGAGVKVDDRETVAQYLHGWLADKRRTRKPLTLQQYEHYVERVLIPALGVIPLDALNHDHVRRLVSDLESSGKSATSVRRIVAVLRSALGDAVRQRRVTHNAASNTALPPEPRHEHVPWTAAQAVAFLDFVAGDRLAALWSLMIGTGLRRGEALALRWTDLDLERRVLFVRRAVAPVSGKGLVESAPKTAGSAAGVGLSPRVVAALVAHGQRQAAERAEWGDAYQDAGLVFCREDGTAFRPEWVLGRFKELTEAAGLPRVRLHDLRHLAASLMIMSGVPIVVVSKVLRHSKIALTSDTYGHISPEVSTAAVDAAAALLDATTLGTRDHAAITSGGK